MARRRSNGRGTLYLRGKTYYMQMRIGDKTIRISSGETDKAKALKKLNALSVGHELPDEERAELLVRHLRRGVSMEVATLLESYLSLPKVKLLSHNTRLSLKSAHVNFVSWLALRHPRIKMTDYIDKHVAQDFADYLAERRKSGTATIYVSKLKTMWKSLQIQPNPWREVVLPRPRHAPHKAYSREHVDTLINAAGGEFKTLLTILAYTGLRISDAMSLSWESVSQDGRAIELIPQKTMNSSGKSVVIPVHSAIADAMGKRPRNATGPVMPTIATSSNGAMRFRLHSLQRKCGIPATYGFHSFRVYFITRLIDLGVPLPQIQKMVGHVSPEMTEHYYRFNAEAAREKVEML